jgi:hypothetical protein
MPLGTDSAFQALFSDEFNGNQLDGMGANRTGPSVALADI